MTKQYNTVSVVRYHSIKKIIQQIKAFKLALPILFNYVNNKFSILDRTIISNRISLFLSTTKKRVYKKEKIFPTEISVSINILLNKVKGSNRDLQLTN